MSDYELKLQDHLEYFLNNLSDEEFEQHLKACSKQAKRDPNITIQNDHKAMASWSELQEVKSRRKPVCTIK